MVFIGDIIDAKSCAFFVIIQQERATGRSRIFISLGLDLEPDTVESEMNSLLLC